MNINVPIILKNFRKYNLTNRFVSVCIFYTILLLKNDDFKMQDIIYQISFFSSNAFCLYMGFKPVFCFIAVYYMLYNVIKYHDHIMKILSKLIDKKFCYIDLVVLSVINLAIMEVLLFKKNIDICTYKVVVNDYLSITGYLCNKNHKSFVNAVIENFYNSINNLILSIN